MLFARKSSFMQPTQTTYQKYIYANTATLSTETVLSIMIKSAEPFDVFCDVNLALYALNRKHELVIYLTRPDR